jgi:uncharacterized protein
MSEVRDSAARRRFEMSSGDALAYVEYTRAGNWIELVHTEVPEALAGQGVGSELVRGVLDRLRAEGVKVIPRCAFVVEFIKRHPEYRDLLAKD